MPWNRTTWKDYKRDGRRYESGVTDQEWANVKRGCGDAVRDIGQPAGFR